MTLEPISLWLALIAYVIAGVVAIIAQVMAKKPERWILAFMVVGVLLHTLFIGLRWERIGHLPVGNTFEALSGNVWGMMLAIVLVYWRIKLVRPMAAILMPIIFIVMGWMMLIPAYDSSFPPTYDTIWLFIHIGFIKIFLGSVLAAVGLAGVILLRRTENGLRWFARMPGNQSLDNLAYRFMALGLIFDTLGVIAGAIWAQDAWGRYWSWDPLETWSLLTWLSLAIALHIRVTWKNSPAFGAMVTIGVFVLAFLTFFGVPFVSTAVHKGAI